MGCYRFLNLFGDGRVEGEDVIKEGAVSCAIELSVELFEGEFVRAL